MEMMEVVEEVHFLEHSSILFWTQVSSKNQGLPLYFQCRWIEGKWEVRFTPDRIDQNENSLLTTPFFVPNENDLGNLLQLLIDMPGNLVVYSSEKDEFLARGFFAYLEWIFQKEKNWVSISESFRLDKEGFNSLSYWIQNKNESKVLFVDKTENSLISNVASVESIDEKITGFIEEQNEKPKDSDVTEVVRPEIIELNNDTSIETITDLDSKSEFVSPNPEIPELDFDIILKSEKPKTKFPIQLKLMGVISLLFALSVGAIIFIASYYFRYNADLQLRENNLKVAEVVGLKVKSDITGVVEKGRQIALTLTTPGLSPEQRKLLLNTFFEYDPEFEYLGIYENEGEVLQPRNKAINPAFLKNSALSEEDIESQVLRNQKFFSEAFLGQAVVVNTSQGYAEPSFAVAIPASENGSMDTILIMIVKLEKIVGAFEKKGIITTFLVNGEGYVIVHPKEELVQSAKNLSNLPIVKSMLTSPDNIRQESFLDPETAERFLGTFRKVGFASIGVITIVPEDKAFEAVYLIQERSLYIAGLGLSFALIFVFFFSKTITKPILALLSATLEIAKGNFRIGIKPTSKDEVGLLTEYFIGMGQGLEEREKVKNILGNMIDPIVVQEAMVDLAALKRGSETPITAFFSDVAGFSSISEKLQSADLASLLNEYLGAMTIILKKHQGVLDKYIGDAIVGIFNAPVKVDDHQLKAARASVEMISKLKELRKFWVENNLYCQEAQEMDCRIGLNSGLAKVGFMGTEALASYTMMGDTVNLAARLEAAGKDYGVNILITDSIAENVKEEMHIRALDLVRVKGKSEPVQIHELVCYKSDANQLLFESSGIYEEGFKAYMARDWSRAIALFEKSEKVKNQKDKACHVLIERCEEYKLNSPGKNWDGVFTRTHK